MKRLLNCVSSEMRNMSKEEFLISIKANDGRTILAENDVVIPPFAKGVTNSEVVVSFGADLVLLNCYDFNEPIIFGLPETENPIEELKRLVGRPIGVNLEPVGPTTESNLSFTKISSGRIASVVNFQKAQQAGFDFICLTGNPGTGVSNQTIIASIKQAKEYFDGIIIAGKMHSAGVLEPIINKEIISELALAGADIILLPAAGTVPGISESDMREGVQWIHSYGKLAMSTIGTTQEGADLATIRELALTSKRAGADIQHIGDAGFNGTADPENIMQLSITIRGKRHTYLKMAQSINR